MKKQKNSLSQKVFLLILGSIGTTILFSFFFLHFLYKDLYLKSIRESVLHQGESTAAHYHYGTLNEEIIEKIHWFNIVSEYEVIVVKSFEELDEHFPYHIDNKPLLSQSDRSRLSEGKSVLKEGYVESFDRDIVSAVFPIQSETELIGLVFIYVPLEAMQEVFQASMPILILAGAVYFILLFLVVNRIRQSLFKPLHDMQKLSQEVAKGNYTHRLHPAEYDEVGQLAEAFNIMSSSLEEQETRKKEFISNVVHELRTPLTYINGYTEALKQNMYSTKEEADSYLTTIQRETDRLNQIVHDLIDLNYLEESLYVINKEPIAVAQLLYDTLDLFTIRLSQKQLQTIVNIDEDMIILGDQKRMEQVFYNLVDNAVKYSPENETIMIELTRKEHQMVFRINNNGLTIDQKDLPRLGERFFRTDKARTRSTGGTGLGLSIVKQIIALHGGTITYNSDAESGTEVLVVMNLMEDTLD
ncbi:cell wall metabolism sensor histidine kinase WalK [Bacillus sp. Marseille-Q1617]|uniref:sensor histidine kinase n=1 Tax=Bacillus sp. Marseille-Q1617 TaxID=2736887 RepID=UPI00158A1ED0|nr:HAMP domain-containing sensor histidine kinase [Bacillus sp. Marseille-Q1617]